MKGKSVSSSAVIDQVIEVFPNDLNSHGTLFGGRLMQIVDMLAAIVAKRHSGKVSVTLGIDSVRFLSPARRGDILVCKASVNKTWRTSMEIGVKVFAEDFRTLEQKHILSAYFTFVAMGDDDKPAEIIPVVPESIEEIRRYREAEERRKARLGEKSRREGSHKS
ncbi:MAG TPA: acyl-CoA thioesterase [Chlamydiales bacterium]|nr:acyl-CoA thioesterase [Chlamydiales bacterium]